MWLLVIWKTHLVHPRFFFAAGIILFGIAALMAFAFLVGTLTSSTAVSIMATFAVFFLSAILANHDRIAAALSAEWAATLVQASTGSSRRRPSSAPRSSPSSWATRGRARMRDALTLQPFVTTGLFGAVCLALACLRFRRKDF